MLSKQPDVTPACAAAAQVILGLTIKEATVLSQAAIAGGALSGAAFALFRGHPADGRMPLLDFRMALVLMPVLLLGTSVGAHAHRIAPLWLPHARVLLITVVCLLFPPKCL